MNSLNNKSMNFHLLLETALMLKQSKLRNGLYNLMKFINKNTFNKWELKDTNEDDYEYMLEYMGNNLDKWIDEYKQTYHRMNNNLVTNLKEIKRTI